MRRVRAKGVNEPCLLSVDVIPMTKVEEVLAIIRDKEAYLPIPTTRILRGHTPSRQRHFDFSFDPTLLFDSL